MTTIGFYAHHVGRGHLDRVAAVCAHLAGVRCTVASSHPEVGSLRRTGCTIRVLPGDEGPGPDLDRTAGGRLHHAPLGIDVGVPRVRALVDWVEEERPDLVLVDVSTEVLLTLRLTGTPVVAVRLHGDRTDAAHVLAFDLASTVVAPFPRSLEDTATPQWLVDRTFHAGLVHPVRPAPVHRPPLRPGDGATRRDAAPESGGATRPHRKDKRCVLVAWGQGSPPPSAGDLDRAALATPGWRWAFAGPPTAGGTPTHVHHRGWVTDVVAQVRQADVVVGPCGDGLVAAVAAGRGRLIALPQPRPFEEQQRKAEALSRRNVAVMALGWPIPSRWPHLLDAALAGPPLGEGSLGSDGAPRLAAHLLDVVAAVGGGTHLPAVVGHG